MAFASHEKLKTQFLCLVDIINIYSTCSNIHNIVRYHLAREVKLIYTHFYLYKNVIDCILVYNSTGEIRDDYRTKSCRNAHKLNKEASDTCLRNTVRAIQRH